MCNGPGHFNRPPGLLGQMANLVRNNLEPVAGSSGSSRLNRRVKRQNIRLLHKRGHHLKNVVNRRHTVQQSIGSLHHFLGHELCGLRLLAKLLHVHIALIADSSRFIGGFAHVAVGLNDPLHMTVYKPCHLASVLRFLGERRRALGNVLGRIGDFSGGIG
ncbi:hypothetical protein D3C73_1131750 [compost metagenome]